MSPCDAQEPRPIRAVPCSRQPPELDHRTHPELMSELGWHRASRSTGLVMRELSDDGHHAGTANDRERFAACGSAANRRANQNPRYLRYPTALSALLGSLVTFGRANPRGAERAKCGRIGFLGGRRAAHRAGEFLTCSHGCAHRILMLTAQSSPANRADRRRGVLPDAQRRGHRRHPAAQRQAR